MEAGLVSIEHLLMGLTAILSLKGMAALCGGVVLGIIIGATPGLSPAMGVALLVPVSYNMNPLYAFIFFVAVYQAANYGGSITAIAINAPGTPSAVVTAIDGYQLTQQGKANLALSTAVLASAIGGFIGAVVLILFAVPVSRIGLYFGPAEYFALALFGLATVVAFAGREKKKATIAICLGLLVSCIGLDSFTGDERFTFGIIELFDGFSFIPVMIGLFALGEIFFQLEKDGAISKSIAKTGGLIDLLPVRELKRLAGTLGRSSLIGTFIGVIPGAGATIASFISYGQARRFSSTPERFGAGELEGVAASEAANSSSVGGALVPLLALGIPGSATDAVLLGALSLHGLVAGPELFIRKGEIVYGIFLSVLFANLLILVFGLLGNQLWLQVIRIPRHFIAPLIISLCILGSYTLNNSLFDTWVCVGAGLVGWILKRYGFAPAAIVLGLVLGDMVEVNLRQGLLSGGWQLFFNRPLSLALLVLAAASIFLKSPGKSKVIPEH